MKKTNIFRFTLLLSLILFLADVSIVQATPFSLALDESSYSSYAVGSYGVYDSGIANMATVDGSAALFTETKVTAGSSTDTYVVDTESISQWTASEGLASIALDNTTYVNGTYSIMGTVNDKTDIEFEYEPSTTLLLDDIQGYNISIYPDSLTTLTYIHIHNTGDIYWNYAPNLKLTINQWNNFTLDLSAFTSVGGMSELSTITELSYHFTTVRNGALIYLDDIAFNGIDSGDTIRGMDVDFIFNDLEGYDHYALNFTARLNYTTSHGDSFWTEDAGDFGSDGGTVTFSNDTTEVVRGTNCIKMEWNATANETIYFDNGASKLMGLDLSDYNKYSLRIWGNDTFTFDYVRWYTDAANYYQADFDITYSTSKTNYPKELSQFQLVGSPSRSNISYVEWKLNNITNTNPLSIYFDYMKMADTDTISVEAIIAGVDTTSFEKGYAESAWTTNTLSLDTAAIQNSGTVTITIIDEYRVNDQVNSTLEIDFLVVSAWNDVDGSGGGGTSGGDDTATDDTDNTDTNIVTGGDYTPPAQDKTIAWIIVGGSSVALIFIFCIRPRFKGTTGWDLT